MPVIKRYSNRKLYDTESKRYVTLEDLAESIRQGEEVSVVDHVSGEDLTSITLLQILFEEQKKIGSLLPQVFLTRMIRAGDATMNNLRSRLASLDPFQVVDEEIRRRLNGLVDAGKLSQDEGDRLQILLVPKTQQADIVHIPLVSEEEPAEDTNQEQEELADAQEIEALMRQVDALEDELDKLRKG